MRKKVPDHEIELKILGSLIVEVKATTQHLIELTDLKKYYKNPYDALATPLENLRLGGYIDLEDTKLKETVGGPKSVRVIRQNSDTIAKIYTNYEKLKELLYQTDWVIDTLVNERFPPHISEGDKGILKRYLGASPQFF